MPASRDPDTVTFRVGTAAPIVPHDHVAAEDLPGPRRPRRAARLVVAGIAALAAATSVTATAWAYVETRPPPGSSPSLAGPTLATGPCAGTTPQPLTDAATVPSTAPAGWRRQDDPAGFSVPVPAGWTRAVRAGSVCFIDPGGARTFDVEAGPPAVDSPLLYWRGTEISALAEGTLTGYRRVDIADTGPGAYWEYTWQPTQGPRLHTRSVLLPAADGDFDELSWTTPDSDWAANTGVQGTFVDGFHDSPVSM